MQRVCKDLPPRENQWGQMPEFAVQPHLINNIIVLLHTTIKATPPPFHFPLFSFYFRIWQHAVLWHGWGGATAPQEQNASQRPDTSSTTRFYQTGINTHICDLFCYFCAIMVYMWDDLRTNHKCICNKWNTTGLKFTYISASNKTPECKSWVSRESLCLHACSRHCSSVHFDWGYFFLTSIAKEVTPHISKLLSEDKQ